MSSLSFPTRYIISAGTYDGVVAGWDSSYLNGSKVSTKSSNDSESDDEGSPSNKNTSLTASNASGENPLQLSFAMAAHEGSVRALAVSSTNYGVTSPPMMVSAGFDEMIRVYDLSTKKEIGETRSPPEVGSPTCCCYCASGHLAVGTTSGKIIVYSTKTFTTVHIMGGHSSPVTSLTPHPNSHGGLVLSCSAGDGTIRLWDMLKGRNAYVQKVHPPINPNKNTTNNTLTCVIFSPSGNSYAFSAGKTITVKDTNTGKVLLNIPLPARVNDLSFLGPSGDFLVAALDDGSLPLMKIESVGDNEIKATMAISPQTSGVKSGEVRLKCVDGMAGGSGYIVVACNSKGVVSMYDLEGACNGLMEDDSDDEKDSDDEEDDSDSNSDDEDEDAAVLLQRVTLGSGARIMCISVWSAEDGELKEENVLDGEGDASEEEEEKEKVPATKKRSASAEEEPSTKKGKENKKGKNSDPNEFKQKEKNLKYLRKDETTGIMDDKDLVNKARVLIEKAKKGRDKKKEKKNKKNKEAAN